MTVDHEQIRRDANEVIEEFAFDAPGPAIRTAHHCFALLAKLEQAEQLHKQRYDWAMHERDVAQDRAEQAEARIAAHETEGT